MPPLKAIKRIMIFGLPVVESQHSLCIWNNY